MFPIYFNLLARVCLFAISLGLLTSCATAPANIKRAGVDGEISCSLRKHSLEFLLEQALKDRSSDDSTHALAHFVERWQSERGGTDSGEVTITYTNGNKRRYFVQFNNGHGSFPLTYFDHVSPAVDFKLKKIPHYRRQGVGAPLVALRENTGREAIEVFYPPEAITRPVTAVIELGEMRKGVQEVHVDLQCPLQVQEVTYEGKSTPLAADLSVPWAALLSRGGDLNRSRVRDFIDRTPTREPRLYLMEPYDPNKEPLIMIHGLLSSPLVWAKLSNELWADDEIRKRYQIWHYLYNTSAPALYSARILRSQLRELRPLLDPSGRDPAMQSTTVIAHSMGGLVARGLITRPGEAFWNVGFTQSFDSLKLSGDDRDTLKEAFYWQPEAHVKRVIYMAVPHLGSDVADHFVGWLGHLLAKPPNKFKMFYDRISAANPGAFTPAYAELGSGKLDSIHALSPKQPTLSILANLPNAGSVREFSLIGDRGKPGLLKDSSDGVVSYWSSHLERAESEVVFSTDHSGVTVLPEAVDEVKRILKLR
ncbi:MAG: alpha/beta hydrolase [Verrucomicrobia bacterium]|nr:alpha/beta hydrolase [Verrucomicrobiota bacterium]